MQVRGEINCMSCGRFLGEVRGEAGKRVDKSWWVAGNATTEPRFTNRGVYCGRCGGRALIERVDKVYVG